MNKIKTISALLCIAVLSACGGGGSATPPPAAVTPPVVVIPPVVIPPVVVVPPINPADADVAATPRRLDAQPTSGTTVFVTWKDATSDETAFVIERRVGSGAWSQVGAVAANVTLYKDTTTAASTTYDYRVTATRPTGTAIPSAPFTVTTPSATVQSIFFVDAVNGNNANPGTEASPWQTIQKAHDAMTAGQTVLIRAGTYTSTSYTILVITNSGTANAWITYKAYPGELPKMKSTVNKNYQNITINSASYIIIDGLDIEGHASDVDDAGATAEWKAFQAGTTPGPYASSSGINIDGRKVTTKPHHLILRNNIIHDHPSGGIGAADTDYVTIENNRVYNVAKYSSYGGSGISFLVPRDIDNNTTDYKLIIRGNVVSQASNLYPCKCYNFVAPTDGNGIILDTYTGNSYKGKTLVTNNIVFDNGGRGIHAFYASNVDIFYNTTVGNSTIQGTGEGEITVKYSQNVRVYNNIMWASDNRPANATGSSTNADFNYNIVFGATGYSGTVFTQTTGGTSNRLSLDPKLAGASTLSAFMLAVKGATGLDAFKLSSASPAVNTGNSIITAPTIDVFSAPRPRGGTADVGAVESF